MKTTTIPRIIEKKRDGEELTEEEIKFFIKSLINGDAQPSQLGELIEILIWL